MTLLVSRSERLKFIPKSKFNNETYFVSFGVKWLKIKSYIGHFDYIYLVIQAIFCAIILNYIIL